MTPAELLETKKISSRTLSQFRVDISSKRRGWGNLISDPALERLLASETLSDADRLTLILHDEYGRPYSVAYRAENTKYFFSDTNSPKPTENLYGLNFARYNILEQNYAVLVEGYFDVLALHDSGITTAVSPFGTNLTQTQIALLAKYAETVFIVSDPDPAGEKAAQTAFAKLTAAGFKAVSVVLPDALDPDEFVRSYGSEAFLNLCLQTMLTANAVDLAAVPTR